MNKEIHESNNSKRALTKPFLYVGTELNLPFYRETDSAFRKPFYMVGENKEWPGNQYEKSSLTPNSMNGISQENMNISPIVGFNCNQIRPSEQHDLVNYTCVPSEQNRVILQKNPCNIGSYSGIYMPPAQSNNEMIKTKETEEIKPEEVADLIVRSVFIRYYDGNLYMFALDGFNCYRKMEGKEVIHFIDKFVKECKIKFSPLKYDNVKKCLASNSEIVVKNGEGLPPNIWPFRNFLVNIESGEVLQNPQGFFNCYSLCCEYIPGEICPQFDTFIAAITNYDETLTEAIWQIIGYLMADDNNCKKFFVFQGVKDTGKSLLAKIIAALLGEEGVCAMNISEFGEKFSLAELKNKRLAISMDLTDEPLSVKAVGAIKSITGNDLIRTEGKFKTGETVHLKARLLFGTNNQIHTKKSNIAFMDRQYVVPFYYQVPPDKQDKNLFYELTRELPGIALKAMKAYLRLVKNNYILPQIHLNIPEEMCWDHEKIIEKFSQEKCDFSDPNAKTSTESLYKSYMNFTNEEKTESLEKDKFSELFNKKNVSLTKKKINVEGKSLWGYLGVKLKFQG